MAREFCPHCRAVCNMQVTLTHEPASDSESGSRKGSVWTFHCERCGLFVRSERAAGPRTDKDEAAESPA